MTDTVSHAQSTPDTEQPFAELGLAPDEYERIRATLGRRPTHTELAMYSVMWSEHCSYKSSRVHLKQFATKAPETDTLLVGMGENAGVIDAGDGLAVTFKVESHNHPSYIEPYQGAATGVGGIVRDILTMGARPVAVMDSLRFGETDNPDTARVVSGVVAGVGGYGNCLGLPNIGGETVFDACYQGNPLVNALSLGVMKHDDIQLSAAKGAGNAVVLLGSLTGRDGIGGVSVLASSSFDEDAEAARPSVQVGDPFTEKILIECCLELYEQRLITGVQDLGGAGLTCATSEMAAAGSHGMRVELENVPLREASMPPHEIISSESQERMLCIVEPDNLERVYKLAEKWGVRATRIGSVGQEGENLLITWRGETVADLPAASLADEGPVYHRPVQRSDAQDALIADRAETLPRSTQPDALHKELLRVVSSPNLADNTVICEQYDPLVLGNTVAAAGESAGILRIDEETGRGVALSLDGNGRFAQLDPYTGAQLNLAEAYRNVSAAGAAPLAVTNCLNFGSPEDPHVMWQFSEATRGLADACQQLGVPVTGGNVSFYNATGEKAIHPTPVIGVLGVLEDVQRSVSSAWQHSDDALLLLGATREELSGSEWAHVVHKHLGGTPPAVDLEAERAVSSVLVTLAQRALVHHTSDLSLGGLAAALVRSAAPHSVGGVVDLTRVHADPSVALFSESAGRALLSVAPENVERVREVAQSAGVTVTELGRTRTEPVLHLSDELSVPLEEVQQRRRKTLTPLFS